MLRQLCLAAALCLPLLAAAQHAHEHGVARLDVALEGGRLVIGLDSPLDNLAGFEHAPRTDRQRAALKSMEEQLRAGERLFALPPAAGCKPVAASVSHPHQGGGKAAPPGKPDKLDGEAHADLQASWEFACANPAALDRVEVKLFEAFRGLKRLQAQSATPKGQGAATLSAARRALAF
jgi:hypothetical protein